MITADSRLRLSGGSRLMFDPTRGTTVLLYPEGVLVPNETAADILAHCDGRTTVSDIAAALSEKYDGVELEDVRSLLVRLAEQRLVEIVVEDS